MNSLKLIQEPWYADGLHFACTGCGACCTGSPGYVFVDEQEVQALAEHFKLDLQEFARRYLRSVGDRLSLKELEPSYDCIFLNGKQCSIYALRPKQCRTFPFWGQNLRSKEAWLEAAQRCEGISQQAPLVSQEDIKAQIEKGR